MWMPWLLLGATAVGQKGCTAGSPATSAVTLIQVATSWRMLAQQLLLPPIPMMTP
jgi:hypothetical protein